MQRPRFDRGSAPRYRQIADLMRQRIDRGLWTSGQQVPTLEALAGEFGVARVTARQAVDVLVREGLLQAQQGRGTFVTGQPGESRWLKVDTSLAALVEAVKGTEVRPIDERLDVRAPLADDEGLPAERYVNLRRVHSRHGQPYCVISLYLDAAVFRRRPKAFRTAPVIPLLAREHPGGIARARQVLTIGTADLEVASLLDIAANAPVAIVRRIFQDPAGTVIYLGEVTYRGDFIRLDMDLAS